MHGHHTAVFLRDDGLGLRGQTILVHSYGPVVGQGADTVAATIRLCPRLEACCIVGQFIVIDALVEPALVPHRRVGAVISLDLGVAVRRHPRFVTIVYEDRLVAGYHVVRVGFSPATRT